jgi:hypothetical protein
MEAPMSILETAGTQIFMKHFQRREPTDIVSKFKVEFASRNIHQLPL